MGRFRLRNRVVEAPEPDALFSVPARFNFTRDVVEAAASADGYRHAMTFVDHEGIIDRRTYKEIAHDASRWTSLLRSRGLDAGDRVAILVGRTPLWQSIVLGALKGGFVVVPCPESFDAGALTRRSEHCDARATVTDRAHAPSATELAKHGGSENERPESDSLLIVEDLKSELRGHPVGEPTHDTAADDPAFILYTAGTSGAPKGAVHTHASTWMMRLQAEHWLGARPDDIVWCTAETGSALSVWNSLIGPWSVGSEIAMHERAFDVEERFDLIGRLGATILCQPPSEYRRMAEHPELGQFQIGSVRHAVSTGAPLDSDTVDAFRVAFGITIHDGYGQAETGILVANLRESEVGVGSLGEPLPGYDIAVLDDRGNEQPVGAEGEIALRGRPPSLFTRYWNDPAGTEAAFLADWYLPGDRVTRDRDGFLWFAGRGEGQNAVRRVEQARAAEVEAAAAAEAEAARKEAAAAAAAVEEQRRRQEEEEAAERVRREEAERVAAAEQQRLEEDRARAADDAQRSHAQEATAETALAVTDLDRNVGATTASAVESPPSAKQSRREAAAARRSAKAEAKKAEQQRKLGEKRRREEEKATAEQARRDEAEARRAAQAKAREDEQQRMLDEKRRREEEKAAAEQARRDEAEAKRAAETQAREDEQQRKREKEQERKQAASAPAPTVPDEADPTDEDDARISAELIARLRAYGHGDSSENATKDQE